MRPIHAAAATARSSDGVACIAKLLAAGANAGVLSADGKTALDIAVDRKATDVEQLLRAADAATKGSLDPASEKEEV